MGETTQVQVTALEGGRPFCWLADCNVLLVSADLDAAGRVEAVGKWADELRADACAQLPT